MSWYKKIPNMSEQPNERYLPNAFDDSLTLLQKVNRLIPFLNQTAHDLSQLKLWLEKDGLSDHVISTLHKWLDDGTLATLINDEVFNMKLNTADFEAFVLEMDNHLVKSRLVKKYRGSSVMLAYHPDETTLSFSELLDKLEESNVNTVSICPRFWADNDTSTITGYRTSEIVNTPYIVDLCRQAKEKGFYVLLKPHVSGQNFSSYNSIQPKNPELFIVSYGNSVKELFNQAKDYVDILSVTNEMDNQTKLFPQHWTTLIKALRTIKPTIKLTNASRPDDLLTNVFLGELDYIGVNLYLNIGGDLSSPLAEQERNMLQSSDRVNTAINTALRYGKELIVTEIGTQPYLTGLTAPESWSHEGEINYDYQSRYYNVVLKNLIRSPLVKGTMIWQSAGAPLSGSFGFVNNPSEATIRSIYGGVEA